MTENVVMKWKNTVLLFNYRVHKILHPAGYFSDDICNGYSELHGSNLGWV